MATKTYLYQPDRKYTKQGAFLTDEDENTVYEAKMLKNSLFGGMQFEFVNHVTGQTREHKVGHTLTSESNNGGFTDMLSRNSRFKLDGKNVWDALHEEGIRIDSRLAGGKLGMSYHVTLRGRPLAEVETSSKSSKGFFTSDHFYRVTADEADLDLAFLVTFAIARTEQMFYS